MKFEADLIEFDLVGWLKLSIRSRSIDLFTINGVKTVGVQD